MIINFMKEQLSAQQGALEAVKDKLMYFNRNPKRQDTAQHFQGCIDSKIARLPCINNDNSFTYSKKYRSVSLSPFVQKIPIANSPQFFVAQDDEATIDNSIDQSNTLDRSLGTLQLLGFSELNSYETSDFLQGIESKKQYLKKKSRTISKSSPKVKLLDQSIDVDYDRQTKQNKHHFSIKQIFDEQHDPMPTSRLIDYFLQTQELIMQAVTKKDFELMLQLMQRPLEICQIDQQIVCFQEIILFLAQFSFDCELNNKSVFLLNQSIIISERTRNYLNKCRALILLSSNAKKQFFINFQYSRLQLYEQCIALLKKALMYSWITNDFESEISCYDLIGLTYFYLGKVNEANVFHQKWAVASVEPQNQYFRNTALAYIHFYEQSIGPKIEGFDKRFMTLLSLPIANTFEHGYPKCDRFRIIKYSFCDGKKIIQELVDNLEFKQYTLEYYQKQASSKLDPTERAQLPRRIREIKQKYSNNKQIYSLKHDFIGNPNYKVSIEQQIQHRYYISRYIQFYIYIRQLKKFDLEKVWANVSRQVGQTRQPYGDRQEQVYTKHLKENKQKSTQMSLFQSRYKRLLQNLIKTIK